MVDLTVKGGNSTPEITSKIAGEILALISEHGSADLAMKSQSDSRYEPEHFIIVDKEIDRLFVEMASKLSGGFKVADATYDKNGEQMTPPLFYEAKTEGAFKDSLESDLLETDDVYDLFKGGRSWSELKASYKNE